MSSSNHRGKIVLILGGMFSSKTTMLISFAKRHTIANKKIILIKYSKDTRFSIEKIASHDKQTITATFSATTLKPICESKEIENSEVILVDEGQFFNDLAEVCDQWANNGKIVYVAGLNGNYLRDEFPNISKIIPKAEEIIKLSAVCVICGEDAFFTRLLKKDAENRLEIIGGEELYQPRCRQCFDK